MASKKPTAIAAQRPVAPPTAALDKGLWLDISLPVGAVPEAHAAEGLAIAPSVQLVPGQTLALPAHMARRYRLALRGQAKHTEAPVPNDPTVLVLRQGEDLWLTNAQAAGVVLIGFFNAPENQLLLDLSTQTWTLDGLSTGTPIAGTDTQLMHWHGQAEQWPQVLKVSTSGGDWPLTSCWVCASTRRYTLWGCAGTTKANAVLSVLSMPPRTTALVGAREPTAVAASVWIN